MPSNSSVGSLRRFVEGLNLAQGGRAGKGFRLAGWQRKFLGTLLGQRVSALSIPRGNGKTTLSAALACSYLAGPGRVAGADIALVAGSAEQARIAFRHIRQMMRPLVEAQGGYVRTGGGGNHGWGMQDGQSRREISDRESGILLRVVASVARTAHGLAPAFALCDEPSAWGRGLADDGGELWDALRTSVGKITGARIVAIGTRPPVGVSHWFSRLLDTPGATLYAAAEDADPFDEAVWRSANPSLGAVGFRELLPALREEAAEARTDAEALRRFRHYRLNAPRTAMTGQVVISVERWTAEAEVSAVDLPGRSGPLYLGFDAGGSRAMTAAVGHWPQTGRVEALGCFPKEPSLLVREREDTVPAGLYRRMVDDKELVLCGWKTTDIGEFLRGVVERFGVPSRFVCDSYRRAEVVAKLREIGISPVLVTYNASYRDGEDRIRALNRRVLDGRVKSLVSPLLRFGLSGARVAVDPMGNRRLSVGSEAGRRAQHRDDAVAALLACVGEAERQERGSARVVSVAGEPLF